MRFLFQFASICFVVFVDGFCWFTAPAQYQKRLRSSSSRRHTRILPYLGVWPEVNMLPYMGKLPNMGGDLCLCERKCPYPFSPIVIPSAHNDWSKFLICLSLALALNSIADR